MATEAELEKRAAKTAKYLAQMPECECPCGCAYRLLKTRSTEAGRCFSCRSGLHFGSVPLTNEETHE